MPCVATLVVMPVEDDTPSATAAACHFGIARHAQDALKEALAGGSAQVILLAEAAVVLVEVEEGVIHADALGLVQRDVSEDYSEMTLELDGGGRVDDVVDEGVRVVLQLGGHG